MPSSRKQPCPRNRLHNLTTNTLIECIPEGLKQSLDDALSKGATREEVWSFARQKAPRGSMVYLGIHAYLFPERREVD